MKSIRPLLLIATFAIGILFLISCGGTAGSPGSGSNAQIPAYTATSAQNLLPITTQPASATVIAGETVSFKVECPGATNFKWFSGKSVSTLALIPGATAASYTIDMAAAADNGTVFMVEPSNESITIESDIATLTVNWLPAITKQPASVSVKEGSLVSFSGSATGFPAPTITWETSPDGKAWTQAARTDAGLTFNASTRDNKLQVRMLAANSVGTVASDTATLFVSALPQYLWTFFGVSDTGYPSTDVGTQVVKDGQESRPVSPIGAWTRIPDGSSGRMPDLQAANYRISRSGFEVFDHWQIYGVGQATATSHQNPLIITAHNSGTAVANFIASPCLTDLKIVKNYWLISFEITETGNHFPIDWSFVLRGGPDEGRLVGQGTIATFGDGVTSLWVNIPQFSIHSATGGTVSMEVSIANAAGASQSYHRLLDRPF